MPQHPFSRTMWMGWALLAVVMLASCGADGTSPGSADSAATAVAVPESEAVASAPAEDAPVDPPPPATAVEVAATQAALPPTPGLVDACALVSEEEAAAFLGGEILAVESAPGDHTGECTYIAQTTTDRPHLRIAWTPSFGAGDYELVRSMVQNPREAGSDLGDDYYIRSEPTGVQLRLVRGEQTLLLEAYGVSEPDGPLKELAQRLLAEIPPG